MTDMGADDAFARVNLTGHGGLPARRHDLICMSYIGFAQKFSLLGIDLIFTMMKTQPGAAVPQVSPPCLGGIELHS
jgi:hypothetical protein